MGGIIRGLGEQVKAAVACIVCLWMLGFTSICIAVFHYKQGLQGVWTCMVSAYIVLNIVLFAICICADWKDASPDSRSATPATGGQESGDSRSEMASVRDNSERTPLLKKGNDDQVGNLVGKWGSLANDIQPVDGYGRWHSGRMKRTSEASEDLHDVMAGFRNPR